MISHRPTLLLASASPRRQEMLRSLGVRFRTFIPDIPETWNRRESATVAALRLARAKAAEASPGAHEVVVAMDTIVALGRDKLGKPADAREASSMLRLLSGREHRVVTGVAVRAGNRIACEAETTRVQFRRLKPREIEWYVQTGEPFDKAGGYGIQGFARLFVRNIRGCYFNIVGFPVARFVSCLGRLKLSVYDFMETPL